MARAFLTRTPDDDDDLIMESIASREQELASYDANVTVYLDQIAALDAAGVPLEMPPALAHFKGMPNEEVLRAGVSEADATVISSVNHNCRVRLLLFTERAELKKSEMAYQALLNALPMGPRRATAMARLVAKRAAK